MLTSSFIIMNTTQHTITAEEQAAITLLESTGVGVLEAAQLACSLVRVCPGDLSKCRQVVELGQKALQAQEQTVSLAEAGWASVEARAELRATTGRDLRYFLRRILKLQGVGDLPLRAITSKQCREMLRRAFGHSKSMYIKGRALLHSVFAYGMRQEWCDANPVARIEVPKVQETPKEPLPVADVRRLEEVAKKEPFCDMRLSLHLLLYSGIRPAEVSRLRQEDFCWQEGVVIIRPGTSKTGGGRVVPLRGVKQIPASLRVIPPCWQQRWRALRRAAGFTRWVPDVCRHTFASYHAAFFSNLPQLQLEMGHRDVALLRTRYMSPTLRKEAKRFWKIGLAKDADER